MPPISDVYSLKIQMAILLSSQQGTDLIKHVSRFLYQFRIANKFDTQEILSEAYLRAYRSIKKGNPITNLYPWLLKTSLNIVREFSRGETRIRKISKRIPSSDLIFREDPIEIVTENTLKRIQRGLKKLSSLEIEVIILRYLEELPWADVTMQICQQKNCCLKSNSIQQMGKRALNKLKEEFD